MTAPRDGLVTAPCGATIGAMPQAIRYRRYGGPDVLTLDDVPLPEPGPGQVRLAVHAAAVNPYDWKVRSGRFGQAPLDRPAGVGVEVAGTVDGVGPGVAGWVTGQAVFGQVAPGAAATHVLVSADSLVAKPGWLSFEQAAALPVASETASRALRLLDVKAGQTLLVHAASGAVGLMAAQLALAAGATVVGTAGTGNHDALRELGIVPVTYGDGLADAVRAVAPDGVDAVLDTSGRGVLPVSIELAGGPQNVVTIADGAAADYGVRYTSTADRPLPDVLAEVLPLVESGAVRMPIAATFPLERTADAHRLSEDAHFLGKIVITVGD